MARCRRLWLPKWTRSSPPTRWLRRVLGLFEGVCCGAADGCPHTGKPAAGGYRARGHCREPAFRRRIPGMRRREFLSLAGVAPLWGQMASVLVHEHVLVDFVGADRIRPGRYDRDEVFRIARPKLEELGRLGCRRLLECTLTFWGGTRSYWRDFPMLQASRSGRTPACTAQRTISLYRRLRGMKRLRNSRNGGWRRRARLGGRGSLRSASIGGRSMSWTASWYEPRRSLRARPD